MLQALARILVEANAWAESCPCHSGLLQDIHSEDYDKGVYLKVVRDCLSCPLRGRRCAELAAGDFQMFVDKLFKQQASLILLDMHPSLAESEIMLIMQDFERGRQHLITQLVMKLSNWEEGHWHLYGIAHHNHEKAFACYQKALKSSDNHELLLHLCSQELEEDRLLFEQVQGRLDPELQAILRLARAKRRGCEL